MGTYRIKKEPRRQPSPTDISLLANKIIDHRPLPLQQPSKPRLLHPFLARVNSKLARHEPLHARLDSRINNLLLLLHCTSGNGRDHGVLALESGDQGGRGGIVDFEEADGVWVEGGTRGGGIGAGENSHGETADKEAADYVGAYVACALFMGRKGAVRSLVFWVPNGGGKEPTPRTATVLMVEDMMYNR